jgi:hypothetical protein
MVPARLLRLATVSTAVGLAGCAHVARPVEQEIRVETPGCPSATCDVRNDKGAWTVAATPGSARIITSEAALEVSCRANGQQMQLSQASLDLPAISGAAMTAGGLLGGGAATAFMAPALATPFAPLAAIFIVISAAGGAGVGAGVDAASRSFSYPQTLVVPFRCQLPVAAALDTLLLGLGMRGLATGEGAGVHPGAVVVTRLVAGGRAEQAGLRVGDLIVQIGGRDLDGASSLRAELSAAKQATVLSILREGARMDLTLSARPETP